MASKTLIQILSEISAKILTGGRRTTAINTRSVLTDLADSTINKKDGGLVVETLTGYTAELTPTDPKHFAPKKYVDDNASDITIENTSTLRKIKKNGTVIGAYPKHFLFQLTSNLTIPQSQECEYVFVVRNISGATKQVLGDTGVTINGAGSIDIEDGQSAFICSAGANSTLYFAVISGDGGGPTGPVTQLVDGLLNIVIDATNGNIYNGLGERIANISTYSGLAITNVSNGNAGVIKADNIISEQDFQLPADGGTLATESFVNTGLSTKQSSLTFDSNPSGGSSNPVTSDGIFNAINAAIEGTKSKADVAYATTVNIVLSGLQVIDGTLITAGQRILVKDQSAQSENGIYVSAVGSWARSSDANTATELEGAIVSVDNGATNDGTTWRQTSAPITLGSTSISWVDFASAVPDATPTTKGKAKLYTSLGTNVDGAVDQNTINTALGLKEAIANKDVNNGYVGRDNTGGATVLDITISNATASTLAFISSAKKIISATGALFGTWIQTLTAKASPVDADTILVNDSASSFEAKKTTLTQFKAFLKTYFDTLYQTLNANLTAIAGLTTAANKLIYWTGVGSAAVTDLTALGRSLLGASTTQASAIVLGINKFPANTGTFPNGYSGGNYTAPANTLLISPIYTCGKNISKLDLSNVTTLGTNPTLASAALYEFNEVTGDLIVVSQLGQISITATGIASWSFTAIPLTRGKEYMVGYVFNASITLARFTTAINPLFKCNWSTTGTPNGGCTFGLTYTTTLPNTLFSEFGTNQTIILVNQV
jgi:hypothetical protein